MSNLALVAAYIAWYATLVCYWVGLPFVSLILTIAWSRLIEWRIALFDRLGPWYQWAATVTCMYFPALIVLGVYTIKSFNQERVYAPIFGLMALNSVPTWWIVGIAGFILIGVRATKINNPHIIRILLAICGVCYAVSLVLLLAETSYSTALPPSPTVGMWIIVVNVFTAIALLVVVEWPVKLKSWRSIVLLLLFIVVTAFAFSSAESWLASNHITNSD